jgi:hypothetical protein
VAKQHCPIFFRVEMRKTENVVCYKASSSHPDGKLIGRFEGQILAKLSSAYDHEEGPFVRCVQTTRDWVRAPTRVSS